MKEIVVELKKKKRPKLSKSVKFFEEKRIGGIPYHMGCVAIICLITRDYIYCANLGDSRSTLAEKMSDNRIEIVEMSKDQKPSDNLEEERIKAGGKWVVLNRIEGRISIARAIGDWEYKDPELCLKMAAQQKKSFKFSLEEAKKYVISPFAEVKKWPMSNKNDFLILGCDGIWDVYTN